MRLSQRCACSQILLAVCLLPGIAAGSQTDLLPKEIQTLEAANQLEQARKRLDELKSTLDQNDVKAHITLIDNTRDLLSLVDVYVESRLFQPAEEALKTFIPKVSAPRDRYLAVPLQRRLVELQQQAAAERTAREALTRADTYFARELFTRAKEEYSAVVNSTEPISMESKARAKRGVAKASQRAFDAEPFGMVATVYRSVGDAATTIAGWLLTVWAVVPVVVLLWLGRRLWLTNKRTLELTDFTLSVASPSANRELAQQLEDVLDRIRLAGPGTAKLEASGSDAAAGEENDELPPPDLVFVTPSVEVPELTAELEKFVAATPAIQVGPIGLNPQLLWGFARRMFTPRARHTFAGGLTNYDNTLTLRLVHEDRLLGTRVEWRASAPFASSEASPEARITCLVDVACQMILSGQNVSTVTSDCDSLKAYVLGLYALSRPEKADTLKSAAAHFQDALDRDDGNWLARFHLGLTERRRKNTRRAVHHLTWFTGPAAAQSKSLQEHIARHPDFPHVVRYHLASTLAIEDTADPRVDTMLDELMALEHNQAGQALDSESRLQLVMLARSGQSTRDAVRAPRLRDVAVKKEGTPEQREAARKEAIRELQERLGQARQRLHDHLKWFDDHAQELERAAPAAHLLARGIVLHAYGRMQYASGDGRGAIESLTEAVDLLPDYADVRVGLAKAYLGRKKQEPSWPQQVTKLLDRALELDEKNAKARFVYARFYFQEETRDFAKAEPHLLTAPFDPTALLMLAQVLSSARKHAETLDVLERAIALQRKGPTFRVRLYAESLHALVKADPNAFGLEERRANLCRYDSLFDPEEKDNKNYQRVADFYKEICTLMKVQTADEKCFQDQLKD